MPISKESWNKRNSAAYGKSAQQQWKQREDSSSESDENEREDSPNTHRLRKDFTLYPAYCFKASPVWFTWVKLTAYDIHYKLQEQKGFHALPDYDGHGQFRDLPLLLFFLNHPIQFVQVVGVVVDVDEFNEKFWQFTIDDSSGATINVSCRKPNIIQAIAAEASEQPEPSKEEKERQDSLLKLHNLITEQVSIGTVVQAKGTLNTLWETRQLVLERLSIVPTTAHEVALIRSRVEFRRNTLLKPWTVSEAEQQRLHKAALGEADKARQRRRRARDWAKHREGREARHARQVARKYAREEKEREDETEKAKQNGELLAREVAESREETANKTAESAEKDELHLDEVTGSGNSGHGDDERTRLLRLIKKT